MMDKVTQFFKNIDFNIEEDFEKFNVEIEPQKNIPVFYYKGNQQAQTSFYLIKDALNKEESYFLKRYIWSRSNAEIYFLAQPDKMELLAISEPNKKKNKIESFQYNEETEDKIAKIRKSEFDRGTFWLNFVDFIEKIKKNEIGINKKLIKTLKNLKDALLEEYKENLNNVTNPEEIVQALIDRTLFIKFLEDNHIINSVFYDKVYQNATITFKQLLESGQIEKINLLFEKINLIFNNSLFKTPEITQEKWSAKVLSLLKDAIAQKNLATGQLSLFDFDFSAMPIEFIGHIYEVFEEQKNGASYTPSGLAKLIVDEVIGLKTGKVLDPACGSGMFLVIAFRKILANNNPVVESNIQERIKYRNHILKESIFGIEKEYNARRLALFSLYLELLNGISPQEIKNHIVEKLNQEDDWKIFPYNFEENILHANSLELEEDRIPHKDKKFDFIMGNPPFFEIKDEHIQEKKFIENYKTVIDDQELNAKNIIGKHQIAQCFMFKIKDWAKNETRFGFVLNYSNFINEKSDDFRKFFFKYYQIEKFYELSELKNILFLEAKESVCAAIFNNYTSTHNQIQYLKVEETEFAKTFKIPIIQEDKFIRISQSDILDGKITLREYLFANEYDLDLLEYINGKSLDLKKFINTLKNGMIVAGPNNIWEDHTRTNIIEDFKTPLAKRKNISNYLILSNFDAYLKNIEDDNLAKKYLDNFERGRNIELFKGLKIIMNRTGQNLKTVLVKDKLYFDSDLFALSLNTSILPFKELDIYHLFNAILNAELITYFLRMKELKRPDGSFPKNNTDSIKRIPIPKELDEDLVEDIVALSKDFSEGKKQYEGADKDKMNDLIGDLYDLNILEKIRIKEFLTEDKNKKLSRTDIESGYVKAIQETLALYTSSLNIEVYVGKNLPFNLVCVALYFNQTGRHSSERFLSEIIKDIFSQSQINTFLPINQMHVGKENLYIIKENQFKNWSETKAFEDGQEILKKYLKPVNVVI